MDRHARSQIFMQEIRVCVQSIQVCPIHLLLAQTAKSYFAPVLPKILAIWINGKQLTSYFGARL